MPLTDLCFEGARFADHSIALEVGQNLATFQRLVTETAGDLWLRSDRARERLPAHFDELTKLRFSKLGEGPAILPLEVWFEPESDSVGEQQTLAHVVRAVGLIVDAIRSQQNDVGQLPADFPRNRMSRLVEFGETLRSDESIRIGDSQKQLRRAATLTAATRQRLRDYGSSNYEDVVRLYGQLRTVDLDGWSAWLGLPDATRVKVAFTGDQESVVEHHLMQAVAIDGVAEISRVDGFIQSVRSVIAIEQIDLTDREDLLAEWLRDPQTQFAWSALPIDASIKFDRRLYGDRGEKDV